MRIPFFQEYTDGLNQQLQIASVEFGSWRYDCAQFRCKRLIERGLEQDILIFKVGVERDAINRCSIRNLLYCEGFKILLAEQFLKCPHDQLTCSDNARILALSTRHFLYLRCLNDKKCFLHIALEILYK